MITEREQRQESIGAVIAATLPPAVHSGSVLPAVLWTPAPAIGHAEQLRVPALSAGSGGTG
jgi:hypothetical protein